MSSSFVRFIIALVVVSFVCVYGQRNAEEEAICAPFLTSKATSPLIKHLIRNITFDEHAEYSCELVLQDQQLPLQIRVTIHEGLYNLALRHIEQGYTGTSAIAEKTTLIPREFVAYDHAKKLANFMLGSCYFQYTAGTWAMHPMIGRSEEAIIYFDNCITGEAAKDKKFLSHAENQYALVHSSAKAYNQIYDHKKAVQKMEKLLRDFPFDLEIQFLVELWKKQEISNDNPDQQISYSYSSLGSLLLKAVKDVVQKEIDDNHEFYLRYRKTGAQDASIDITSDGTQIETSSSSWQPIRYTEMITVAQFEQHILDRQPFIISLKDPSAFDTHLQWKTSQWFPSNKKYLREKLKDYQVMVESIPYTSSAKVYTDNRTTDTLQQTVFGLGMNAKREYQSFAEILNHQFRKDEKLYYLNIQPDQSGDKPYRPPLHLLQGDLPSPSSQTSDDNIHENAYNLLMPIWKNLTAINLWMGNIPAGNRLNFTQSRLHRDATDNLYLLYEGRKKFYLWSPNQAQSLHTISPVVGINEDGLSYQWNINEFRNFVKHTLQSRNISLFQLFEQSIVEKNGKEGTSGNIHQQIQTNEYFAVLDNLLSNNAFYDLENVHFSKLKSLFDPFHIPSSVVSSTSALDELPLPEVVVDLEPGDIFYLPTGFYHEVISYAGQHTAINIWWKPLNWRKAVEVEKEINERLFSKVLERMIH
eukprot:gene4717-5056_t